jgi:hypothetical protein
MLAGSPDFHGLYSVACDGSSPYRPRRNEHSTSLVQSLYYILVVIFNRREYDFTELLWLLMEWPQGRLKSKRLRCFTN